MAELDVLPGRSFPLGATVYPGGVNFCVFSKNCETMELLLYDDADDQHPSYRIPLDPESNRTFYYWHAFLPHVKAGQLYAYRAYGPFAPKEGHRFNGEKLLLDPYGRSVAVGKNYSRDAAIRPGDNGPYAMKSVVVDSSLYQWDGDMPLRHSLSDSVVYEMHVGGFTKSPSSGLSPDKRGTFAGVIEKIPYLKSLGVTAVELLPVQQFDEFDALPPNLNYWGYSPICLFAPHAAYSSDRSVLGPVNEFRDMVKALHKANIEVILDVVFNHTAEGDDTGPTFSFRGLENRAYYIPHPDDRARYADYSGCGNTINGNQSIVRRLIVDCLRYWVSEMHIDAFRFDLASVLARDEWGNPLKSPPILWEIESDPVLAGTRIIAEAWDAAGLYQVGSFVGHRWAEWNGRFRDDARRFVRGDADTVSSIAARVTGSTDLYPEDDREVHRSINFITCHDGFTLRDLVSYNTKHNEKNGWSNRDGSNENFSWNCGIEGPSSDPQVEALRFRQMKNHLCILFLSQGTQMLLMGDEVGRTQNGNNNAYCTSDESVWFDWKLPVLNGGLLRFCQKLIHMRLNDPLFEIENSWLVPGADGRPLIEWSGVRIGMPDMRDISHTIAFTLSNAAHGDAYHVIFNMYTEALDFELPPIQKGRSWGRLIDTSLPSPDDFVDDAGAHRIHTSVYPAAARSVVVLHKAAER